MPDKDDGALSIGEMFENIIGPLNLIESAIGWACALAYGDAGHQFRIRRVDKGGKHSLPEIKMILAEYGVVTYWYGFNAKHITFRIKKRQARWGEYVLLRAGVKLLNQSFDHRNSGWAAKHTTMPKSWASKGK